MLQLFYLSTNRLISSAMVAVWSIRRRPLGTMSGVEILL